MLKKHLRYFVAFVILLHCVGVTQLLSAYAKDASAFVGMLNMSEEETKKEKETKEDGFPDEAIRQKAPALLAALQLPVFCTLVTKAQENISHQFWAERPTPPPDSRV